MLAHKHKATFFDLERAADAARLANPERALAGLKGLVILDEVQLAPELFPSLRVLADRKPLPCRFLILGSASPWLMKRTSESLAGRVRFVDIAGFTSDEVGVGRLEQLWLRGGFPPAFLANSDAHSFEWREDFIRTFLERDIAQLEVRLPPQTLRRFWGMVAHYHGQVWNGSEIGASLGFSHTTARRYLDALTGADVIRQLPPLFVNVGKRLVKSPKVYVRDSGLLHALLNLRSRDELESHPKLGASWEGFAIEEILRRLGERNAHFWGTHAGAEIDLVVDHAGQRWGFEFKVADAPTASKSMRIALDELRLAGIFVVHPGKDSYSLDDKMEVIGVRQLAQLPSLMRRRGP
jgi:predicted AAA+ superfamily ATPase